MTALALLGIVIAGPATAVGRHLWTERRLDRVALARVDELMASR